MAPAHESPNTLTVSNLPETMDPESLRQFFLPFGEIASVAMADDGSATIEYEEAQDADAARDNMHDAKLYGSVVRVTKTDMRATFEGLGSNVALWQQEGFIQRYLVQDDVMANVEAQQVE